VLLLQLLTFPQVAGIRYLHKDGAFVSALLLNSDGTTSPIEPKKSFTIVATDYMLQVADTTGHKFGSQIHSVCLEGFCTKHIDEYCCSEDFFLHHDYYRRCFDPRVHCKQQ
jgi:hypothetical protein